MVVRGVYSDDEKRILENWNKEADIRVGWIKANEPWGKDGALFITPEVLKAAG